MAITAYGDISQRTAAWVATTMLKHIEPTLVLSKFGLSKPIPQNTAEGVKFRRPVPFPLATTPLTEGVTPASRQMAYEDVPVTLAQYGDWVEITDKIADMSEDPVLSDAAMLCGEQAGETIEFITWGVLRAGTSVFYANGSDRTAVNTVISVNKLRAVNQFLMRQRAKRMTSMMAGSPNYATQPIDGGYVAFGHTDLDADLRALGDSFVPVSKYGSRKPLCPEEAGSVENIRFILSPVLTPFESAGSVTLNGMRSTNGTNVDVYPITIVGRDAYGLVPLKGKTAIHPTVLKPNQPRGGDPIGQRGSVGWKTRFAAVILNQLWMTRLEVGVTDL